MRLTSFSDLSFRVLMYAAANQDHLFTIDEMNSYYRVSRGHMMKVVNALTKAGYLESVRGRSGGLRLGRKPEEINLADVLITTETDFKLVECMTSHNTCPLSPACKLIGPLNEAMASFLETLGKYTLADLCLRKSTFSL
ncbi:DNA-binding protein [Pseudovibrio japonicus]|uniref:DNA-binding protein n=1 Tax=Pseudovibrio japonicus TaxID=366534 RepID=A0ABQ3EMY8_9HYPH|nr:Rrf2 family transcriptional regulator [Pseudovibrio japonicus]GHB42244.1 DNA-binding protein [Pseudovibrio japonicus]